MSHSKPRLISVGGSTMNRPARTAFSAKRPGAAARARTAASIRTLMFVSPLWNIVCGVGEWCRSRSLFAAKYRAHLSRNRADDLHVGGDSHSVALLGHAIGQSQQGL